MRDASYVVLDFETTGLSPRRSEVLEVGAVHVDGRGAERTFRTLCRPERPIPPGAQGVHGITDEMVAGAEPFSRHLPDLLAFLADRTIVAHHAAFDLSFLCAATRRDGLRPPPNAVLCTVRLSRQLFPEIARHDLESLCRHHGIARAARHRALEDAAATARLLDVLLERAEERGITDLEELLPIGSPAARRAAPGPVRLTDDEWRRLEEAIVTGDRVTLRYVSRRGTRSERAVVPYHVSVPPDGGRRLVAYDLDAGTTRTFRLDRVRGLGDGT